MTAAEFQELRTRYTQYSIPDLIALLSSEELPVRFFAEMALRDATGT